MAVLFSNVPPLRVDEKKTIAYNIEKSIKESDYVEIAVGYLSVKGLVKLDELVNSSSVKKIVLIAGMYYVDGIPASIFNKIVDINHKWEKEKIGQIRLVNNMSYHGKLYSFWKEDKIFRTIVGSANLGVLSPTDKTQRQYEVAAIVENKDDNLAIAAHLKALERNSTSAADISKHFKKLHEKINLLEGIDGVETITDSILKSFEKQENGVVLKIPIKAPSYKDRFNSKNRRSYTKSNINVCYGSGRKNTKNNTTDSRDWLEVQITCSKKLRAIEGYPKTARPFYIATDDHYMFEAHTTSSNHKQLSAYGTDRIFGRWIKGRLVASGLLTAFDKVSEDKDRKGMITTEMLERSNMSFLELHKTLIKRSGYVYDLTSTGKLNKKKAPHLENLDVWVAKFTNG